MSNLPTLYELESDWDELMELTESDPDMDLADTIEGMEGTLEVKRQDVGYYLENLRATAEARRAAAKAMLDRARVMENRHERLTEYLISSMRKHGITEIACPEWTMRLAQNPEKVVIDNPDTIPMTYQRVVPERYEPDKKAIKAAIKEGKDVEGAHLERGWRLKVT